MKKMIKFVKGKRDDEAHLKQNQCMKTEESRDDDFINRDKSVTKLHKIIWMGNSEKLKTVIKTHDVDITDKYDRTALYLAVLKNNVPMIQLLLENNANQHIPDIDGVTPFLKSVQLGYLECTKILLEYGADVKKYDKDLNSCIHFAVIGKHVDLLTLLLKHNADTNVSNSQGEYPLHIAVRNQQKEIIKLLLLNKSNVNVKNSIGFTSITLAEQLGYNELVPILKCHNIDNKNTLETKSNKMDETADTWNVSFNEEEEKSEESDTSPHSGIIPPPCKPLRSLEYLQSGALETTSRSLHLRSLSTIRTRHISITESDHSKNNTPHRYSYQGDYKTNGEEKPDLSKMINKLDDSTLPSPWGSDDSLPLDESCSNSFLQKQFTILEDYEKKRHSRKLVQSEHNFDIDHLLEDSNRINAQLEKYAANKLITSGNKSKSLPRNCEPCNSYQKGSFSLPRTLESGRDDPFKGMRLYESFRPNLKPHFFSLKFMKSERKKRFINKLRNMFNNKKSQIYLTETTEMNSWLQLPKSETVDSKLGTELNCNEQPPYRKFVSLNSMSFDQNTHSRQSSSSHSGNCYNDLCPNVDDDSVKSNRKKIGSTSCEQKTESIFCEDCSQFLNLKLAEAEENVTSKETFIDLLKEQLTQLKERNLQSINTAQDIRYKYGVAKQELVCVKQICQKYDDDLQRLRSERDMKYDRDAMKLKQEADKWKRQYETLLEKINRSNLEENTNWCSTIQTEVSTVVNFLKENSQSVVNALEKQNQKLEALVEKLQNDLDASSHRQKELENELIAQKRCDVVDTPVQVDSDNELITNLQCDNEKLRNELEQSNQLEIVLNSNIAELTNCVQNAKETVLAKNKELREQLEVFNYSACDSFSSSMVITPADSSQEFVTLNTCRDVLLEIERVQEMNSCLEQQLKEFELKNSVSNFIDENQKLRNELKNQTNMFDEFKCEIKELKKKLTKSEQMREEMQEKNESFNTEINILESELETKYSIIKNQNSDVSKLKKHLESNEEICKNLKTKLHILEQVVSNEKTIRNNLDEQIKQLKSTIDKYKNEIEQNVTKQTENKIRINNLEIMNQELTEQIESLTNNKCSKEINLLHSENETLKEKCSKEKQVSESLQKAMDSLNFFHENEMTARNERYNELKTDYEQLKQQFENNLRLAENEKKSLENKLIKLCNKNKELKLCLSEQDVEICQLNDLLRKKNIIDYDSISKSSSMPDFKILFPNKDVKLDRKASSCDCLPASNAGLVTEASRKRWDNYLQIMNKLRYDLNEIMEKLEMQTHKAESTKQVSYYKQIIFSLQRQVNELQVKTAEESGKYFGLQAELKGLKGKMVAKEDMEFEILNIKKELYIQKNDRLQEVEFANVQQQAELLLEQEKLKEDQMQSNQKLLTGLSTVQNALEAKNKEETKLKKKCEQLVKEVAINREARKKKLMNINHPSTSRKTNNTKPNVIIQPLPLVVGQQQQQQTDTCSCSKPLPNNDNDSATVVNVRANLKTTLEKRRLKSNAENVKTLTIKEEEFEGKYFLK